MARPCVYGCVRCFLMGLNILFLLSGLAIVGLSVWLHFDRGMLVHLRMLPLPATPGYPMDRIAYALMGIGGGIALVSFLSCCGAWSESSCFLCLYSTLLVLVVLAQIVCGVLIAVFHYKAESFMYNQLRFDFNKTGVPDTNQSSPVTAAWNKFQIEMKCCGAFGPLDYRNSNWYNHTRSTCPLSCQVPMSCCTVYEDQQIHEQGCQADVFKLERDSQYYSSSLNLRGCYSVMVESLRSAIWYIVGSTVGFLLLQVSY